MTETTRPLLRRVNADELRRVTCSPVDQETLSSARAITERVRDEGASAVRAFAEQFGERGPAGPLVLGRAQMRAAFEALSQDDCALLERTGDRIRAFAQAQRDAIRSVDVPIPGGCAGHTIEPIENAGCYAPAGRYPLPSSVLMTAITARVAGCQRVVVASPGANPVALAAAAIAGADEFLAVGGAHAIASMAYGFDGFPPCDVIAGPGNKWVTAAKQFVSGVVGIDMLAGPSELLVLADETADPDMIASDLIAQAEHDTDAVPMLVTTSRSIADDVEGALITRLEHLATRAIALEALENGFACVVDSLEEACAAVNTIAPEHLEIMTRDPQTVAGSIRNAGALFIGAASAEVLGDYGAGPNHTLPTGRTARFQAGLSVMHFLRLRTWMRIDEPERADPLIRDASALAGIEGLAGHAASARARLA
ncbi:MAG: histidinol dehydrogenase [Phycisphaerales bacterium JB043]